jgi:hypothetical protein
VRPLDRIYSQYFARALLSPIINNLGVVMQGEIWVESVKPVENVELALTPRQGNGENVPSSPKEDPSCRVQHFTMAVIREGHFGLPKNKTYPSGSHISNPRKPSCVS